MNVPKLGRLMFALILLVCCVGLVSAQDLGAPQNLMLGRLGDTFDLLWDAPEGPAPDYYILDMRWRATLTEDWRSSSGYSIFDTSASLTVENVQELGGAYSPLYAVEFTLYGVFSGNHGPTASVSWTAPSASSGERRSSSKYIYKPPPKLHTCDIITKSDGDILISSPVGLTSGIQCQHIDGAGIGIQSIIDAGYIDAVDVWGLVPEATVCFKQSTGNFLFLDATTAPRSVSAVEGFNLDYMRCTTITGPGSIVLMPLFA